jgi:hypothetical protein
MVFSTRSVPRGYIARTPSEQYLLGLGAVLTHVEAGSNTSTVTLRVVGGDGKGSVECEAVKYGRESHGTV